MGFIQTGTGLIEHLPMEKIPLANANVRRIAAENEIDIPLKNTVGPEVRLS